MNTLIVAAIRCYLMFLVPAIAYAGSAQWDLNPASGDWNTAGRPIHCVPPICSMSIAPFSGSAPFTANIRYTLTGIPVTSAVIYYGDGTSDTLPLNVTTGFIQHLYTVPGEYGPVLNVANDCGAFALILTVYVTP
jgi:PKD repeat protein